MPSIGPFGNSEQMDNECDRIVECHRLPREVSDWMVDAVAQVKALESRLKPTGAPKYSEARCVADVLTLMRSGGAL